MDPILTQNVTSLGLFVPELILLGTMLCIIIADVISGQTRKTLLAAIGIGGTALSLVAVLTSLPTEQTLIFHGMLAHDSFAVFFKMIAAVAVIIAIVVSLKSDEVRSETFPEYVTMMVGMALGMYTLAASVNLLSMFLAFEAVSMTSYVLTAHRKDEIPASEGALKYVIYSGASAATMIYGMSLLYGLTGSLQASAIAAQLASGEAGLAVAVAFLLILGGIGYKIASVPFHFWCPDAYQGAPAPVAALLSVGPKAAGMAFLARFLYEAMALPAGMGWQPVGLADWQIVIAIISAATMTLGNLSAVLQTSMKRLLAYSSIAHAGYILMGVAMISPMGMKAMMFYLAVYMFMNLGAFIVVIALAGKIDSDDIDAYAGLGSRSPVVAITMAIFLIALAGLPPTSGFIGKFYLFWAVIEANNLIWLAVVAALNSVVALYYYARVIRRMFLTPAPEGATKLCVSPLYTTVLMLLVVPTLLFGVYWWPMWRVVAAAGMP
jgi:NADH-quinone oxidoreductase subunit N